MTADGDYLFTDQKARFEVRPGDVLVALPDIEVRRDGAGVRLRVASLGAELAVPGLGERVMQRALVALDGERTVGEIERRGYVRSADLARLVEATFGSLLFAPRAVEALERALSGIEITRFPGSPYEIERPYWENMIDVRQLAEARLTDALPDVERTVALLRELHATALTGSGGQRSYQPSSRIAAGGTMPGELLTTGARVEDTDAGARFLEGPRVNVSLIGGEMYHRALYALLEDPGAAEGRRELQDADGVDWGRILTGRAETDEHDAPWFCMPRPIRDQHWVGVVGALAAAAAAAEAADLAGVTTQLARLHWRFIHLHPFRCANQCLVMNLVNLVLGRSHGAGMPHQILDHFALRLTEPAYERLFATAVSEYVLTEGGPLQRYQQLAAQKARAYAFIPEVAACGSVEAARALVRAQPANARLALFPV